MKLEIKSGRIISLGKDLFGTQVSGMSLQMVRFSKGGALKMKDMIEHMMCEKENLDQFYTIAIQELINQGLHVSCVDMDDLFWYEIDENEDLEKVRKKIIREKEGGYCV